MAQTDLQQMRASNPLRTAEEPAQQFGGLAEVESQRAIQEVQAALVIAKKFPRNQIQATDRILNACMRPGLAEGALYTYSKGGSDVSGPSIRLAEAIAQNWQNIEYGFRELYRGIEPTGVGFSEVEAYCWDMENNTRKPIRFRVRHWRDTRGGGYALKDERDIYELVANMASRRQRNCILAVIPGDVVEAAQNQCELTLKASADTSDEAIKKIVEAFKPFGVTKAMIESRIQRKLVAIQPAQVVQLKKIYASLRDGMSQVGEWFESSPDDANDKTEKPAAQKRTQSGEQGAGDRSNESRAEPDPSGPTYADLAARINKAQDADDVHDVLADIGHLPAPQQKEIKQACAARIIELTGNGPSME